MLRTLVYLVTHEKSDTILSKAGVMLLTHLSSLQLKVDDGQLAVNAHIHAALSKVLPLNAIAEGRVLQEDEALNLELWALLGKSENSLLEENDIDIILNGLSSCAIFDEKTWAILHLICASSEMASAAICEKIRVWLQASMEVIFRGGESAISVEVAMQARLFLMSQPEFDITVCNSEIFAISILESQDANAWFALLSRSNFDVTQQSDITNLRQGTPAALEHLWGFVRVSGIGPYEIENLLNNIVNLNIQADILACPEEHQSALIKMSSSSKTITEPTMHLLAAIGNKLIQSWGLDLTEKQKQDLSKPANKFKKLIQEITQEIGQSKSMEEIAVTFKKGLPSLRSVGQYLFDATWEIWAVKEDGSLNFGVGDPQKLKEVLDKITDFGVEKIVQDFYNPGRDKSQKGMRKGKAEDILRQFINLLAIPKMLDFLLKSDSKAAITDKINESLNLASEVFFSTLFNALWGVKNDSPRICSDTSLDWLMSFKAFKELNFLTRAADTPGYILAIFTANDSYFIEKLFILNSNHSASPLISAMMKYPNKDFAPAKQIMDLEEIFVTAKTAADLENKPHLKKLHHPKVFVHALKYHYAAVLMNAIDANKNSSDRNIKDFGYKRIKRIFKLSAELPSELKAQLEKETWYAQFRMQYRLSRYERMGEGSEKRKSKVLFTDYFIKHLPAVVREYDKAIQATGNWSGLPPLREAYRLIHGGLPKGMAVVDIEKWFLNTILHNTPKPPKWKGSKMAQALADLPSELIAKFFVGTTITHETIWKKGYPNIEFTPQTLETARQQLLREEMDDDTSSEASSSGEKSDGNVPLNLQENSIFNRLSQRLSAPRVRTSDSGWNFFP